MKSLASLISHDSSHGTQLQDGARVAVVGGGPAGSFFAYFLCELAQRAGLELGAVDIYEPRDFSHPAPQGCNMCGGIISESLVQHLAMEGIRLPADVVQRGIDSYFLHMDVGSVKIDTPLQEKRIAAVHRSVGPRGLREQRFRSFDGYLLGLAMEKGAKWRQQRVNEVFMKDGKPTVQVPGGTESYDLLCVAVGINAAAAKLVEKLGIRYEPPHATKAYICEYLLGEEAIDKSLGNSMHVFLLPIPRLEFAALIPKGDYVTVCLLGDNIDKETIGAFLHSREVRECLPADWSPPGDFCHCGPKLNIHTAIHPFGERVVMIGDCGATRLYKDGIGAAYRTAKAAAVTAVFDGIGKENFQQSYWSACRSIHHDNIIGKFIFLFTHILSHVKAGRRGVWQMVAREQHGKADLRRMSTVLWDVFTGSAPYSEVFLRTLRPAFLGKLAWNTVTANAPGDKARRRA